MHACLESVPSPPRHSRPPPPSSPSSSACRPPSFYLCLVGCHPARPGRAEKTSYPAASVPPSDPGSTGNEKAVNQ